MRLGLRCYTSLPDFSAEKEHVSYNPRSCIARAADKLPHEPKAIRCPESSKSNVALSLSSFFQNPVVRTDTLLSKSDDGGGQLLSQLLRYVFH